MIQGLEEYTGCKVLHLEGNCLRRIEGLSHMTQLRYDNSIPGLGLC